MSAWAMEVSPENEVSLPSASTEGPSFPKQGGSQPYLANEHVRKPVSFPEDSLEIKTSCMLCSMMFH